MWVHWIFNEEWTENNPGRFNCYPYHNMGATVFHFLVEIYILFSAEINIPWSWIEINHKFMKKNSIASFEILRNRAEA
jgi:hypothetical protein